MTRTSGVHAYSRDLPVMCMACDWTGTTEGVVDDEDNTVTWTCPNCTTPTEEEWR